MKPSSPYDPARLSTGSEGKRHVSKSGYNRRMHERFALAVHASVTIATLATADYGVCELSETGMFLAFTDTQVSRSSLEDDGIGPGSGLKIGFSVPVAGKKQRCDVTAEIARITDHGIGVRFVPEDPAQLSALIDAFVASYRAKHRAVG